MHGYQFHDCYSIIHLFNFLFNSLFSNFLSNALGDAGSISIFLRREIGR